MKTLYVAAALALAASLAFAGAQVGCYTAVSGTGPAMVTVCIDLDSNGNPVPQATGSIGGDAICCTALTISPGSCIVKGKIGTAHGGSGSLVADANGTLQPGDFAGVISVNGGAFTPLWVRN